MITSNTFYLFDLDGTVTSQEILPLIAKEAGIFQEIETLTEATIKGIIPFESSFKLRCLLLKDVPLKTVHKVIENVKLYEQIANFIYTHQDNCAIITGNLDIWIEPLFLKFKNIFTSTASKHEGHLFKVEQIMKKDIIVQYLKDKYPTMKKFVAIGDGMGDVSMFQESDVSIAFGGTHKPVESLIKSANYVVHTEESVVKLLKSML